MDISTTGKGLEKFGNIQTFFTPLLADFQVWKYFQESEGASSCFLRMLRKFPRHFDDTFIVVSVEDQILDLKRGSVSQEGE